MEEKEYKKYEKIRNKLSKLMDKYGQEETLQAMADWITTIMEDDAIEFIKQSLEIHKEIVKEED